MENNEDTSSKNENDLYVAKMEKIRSAKSRILASKTEEKGLIIVHTGNGKGKSSAAFGMAMRMIGHGHKIAIIQFLKGGRESGEVSFLRRFPDLVHFEAVGDGFTWETQDRQKDIDSAQRGWELAKRAIEDTENRFVLLDELNIILRYDYLPLKEVTEFLSEKKPYDTHVVITGRHAKPEMIELADLVTEMVLVKHPFRSGIKAQEGIEF